MLQNELDFLDDLVLDIDKPSNKVVQLPKLYSRSSTGVTQEWTVEIDGPRYRTIAGQQGGVMTTSKWTVCLGKNIGRANETTDEQQAMADARSKWRKKVADGGQEQLDKVGAFVYTKPMLAKTWQKLKKYPLYPLYVQRKYNGMRCIIKSNGMWTRKGKPILSAPHIYEAVKHLFITQPTLVLDGELYNHTLRNTLNRLIKLVRKTKNITAEDLEESKKIVLFYNYDGFNVNGLSDEVGYLIRRQALCQTLKDIPEVYLVETEEVHNQKELDAHFEKCKSEGYEGQIIRVGSGKYEFSPKRSSYLIKRKDFIDDEYMIVAVNEGTGDASGIAATFTCKTEDGKLFNTNLKGPDSLMAEVLRNKDEYIGKMGTVVFQELSEYGIPQFPYCDPSLLRDYE